MSTIYLNAGYDGTLYETSKTPKDGFEEHTSTKGKLSYRKTYKKGLYAIYKAAELRESQIGQQLSITTTDEHNNTIYLQVPFKDQKGSIDTFAEALIAYLPYLEVGQRYRFYAYKMEVPGTTYFNTGISVKFADSWETVVDEPKVGKLLPSYTKKATGEVVIGHIPAVTWAQNFEGKNIPNKTEKDTYLYGILGQYGKIPPPPAAKPAATAAPVTPAAVPPPPPPPATQQPVATPPPPVVNQTTVTPPPPPPVVATVATPPVVLPPASTPPPPPPPPAVKAQAAAPAAAAVQTGQTVVYVAPPAAKGGTDDLPF